MATSKKNYRDIPANYYLFGCYFPSTEGEGGTNTFPTWSSESDLTGELLLKNIKPLVNMPVAVNLDSPNPALWGTNEVGQLMVLSNKREKVNKIKVVKNSDSKDTGGKKPADEYIALRKESPVNSLVEDQYKLSFPPLTLLASIATINPTSAKFT